MSFSSDNWPLSPFSVVSPHSTEDKKVSTMDLTNLAGDNKKRSRGKQRIDIKRIKDRNSRQVTFSKRRTGLFKKAAEICVLTGAQISILVNSPARRSIYAFRQPNSDALFDRYLTDINKDDTGTTDTGTTTETKATKNYQTRLPISEYNQHYVEVSREVEAEKKRRGTIPVSIGWYDAAVDGLDEEELQGYLCSLRELKNKVMTRANEMRMLNESCEFFGSIANEMGIQPVPISSITDGSNLYDEIMGIQPVSNSSITDVDGGLDFDYGEDFGNLI